MSTKAVVPMSEADLQRAVTDLASMLGWRWAHFRPAQTNRGWRTPVSGPLGKGWPDLTLLRVRDRRLLFVELKRDGAKPTAEQAAVLAALGELAWCPSGMHVPRDVDPYAAIAAGLGPCIDVKVWTPADLDSGAVLEALR